MCFFSPFFQTFWTISLHYLELIYDEYVLETLQNKAVRVAYNKFLHFLSSFYAVMHTASISILLMPEMPAK